MALTSRQRWQWRGSVDDTATTCHAIRDTRLTFVHHRRHVSSSTHHVVGSAITSACHPLTICDDCRSPTRDTRMARHRVAVVLAGGDRHRHWRRRRWSVGEHLGQLAKSPLWTPHKMGPKSTLWTPPKSGPKSTLPTPPKIGGPGSPPAPPARPRKFPGAGAAARARRRPPKIRQNRGSGRYLAKGPKTGVLGAKINGFHRDLGGSGQGAQAPRTAQIRGGVFRPGFPGSGKCHILLGI